ncbi:hypothetical protein E2562_012499 [Oryza meyeriana var. granulata]|uniref:Uncharacterized protein n=1 Tax=Oryza meyeriana var. granulata TaxID=110450 RepID=A0A6G1BWG5_9ORYZ|nr:hypothetical protein E2562_012499 [Oryza meyeriana var. granulata]
MVYLAPNGARGDPTYIGDSLGRVSSALRAGLCSLCRTGLRAPRQEATELPATRQPLLPASTSTPYADLHSLRRASLRTLRREVAELPVPCWPLRPMPGGSCAFAASIRARH